MNYHPISPMNTDYKILVYVLSNRLAELLPDLIAPQQSAYMKGRFIGTNIHSVQDMIDYTVEHDLDYLVLFLDFKKAFDSVSHQFLFKLMAFIGVPADFIS